MKNKTIFGFTIIVAICTVILLISVTFVLTSYAQQTQPVPILDIFGEKVKRVKTIVKHGGRVGWSPDGSVIAFDKPGADGYFDVWLMKPDGSNEKCITCSHKDLPDKHIGNPAWHPSGEYLVIQVEKSIVPKNYDNKAAPGAGVLNDLYIITKDGGKVWELYRVNDAISKDSSGVLHPHFSHNGKKLAWAERIKNNGRPFGEWAIKIADFKFADNIPILTNIETLKPGSRSSFYETHTFSPDDSKLLFTGNQDGSLEIYELDIKTKNVKRLTNNPTGWDEHATYSPDGTKILWMSSKNVKFRKSPFYLQTEFWIMDADGNNKERITYFHEKSHPHNFKTNENDIAVAADNSWGPNGNRVIALIITANPKSNDRDKGRIVMIEFGNDEKPAVGTYDKSMIHNGLKRTYRIHIPASFDKTRSIPLVIALHGGGGTAEDMMKLTFGGFITLADKEGFIVVYPDGIERHWNDGREEVKYCAHKEKIDDVGFISTLIDHLIEELNIDKKRVYVTGMSNGALMSHRLACELSERITAIAPVAGAMPEKIFLRCSPSRPVSVLIINGAEDTIAPWEGGDFYFGRLKLGKKLSVPNTVKYWVTCNKCSAKPVVVQLPDTDPSDGTRVRREIYGQGKEGTEVILYIIEGGGHTWPDGYQYLPESFVGKTSKDISANRVIWDFFKRHTRR